MATLLAGVGLFGNIVHAHYPVDKWMFWRYAGYWLACLVWSVACLSGGHLLVRSLLKRPLPLAEHLATCFALGCFIFFLLMFLLGALQLYQPALFYLLPLGMIAAGGRPLYRYSRRAFRALRTARRKAPPTPLWRYALMGFGLVALLMIYFVILSPDHAQFDARWKHLALAEDYWAHGGIRRFPEGWTVATYPHLVSFLFTWAFLVPGGELFDQIELCAHMEFTVFLWILVAVVGLTRLLVPRTQARHAWVARFLFPGIFLYDSSLATGADHIGALFAIPIFSLLIRAYRHLSPAYCSLLAMMMAGAALVKYTSAIMLFPVPCLVIALRGGYLAWRAKGLPATIRRNWYWGPLAALMVGLLVTAPHWLKNIIWYGDPMYPTFYKHLSLRPWIGQDGGDMFEWGYKAHQFWRPTRDWEGVKQTLGALFNFSFIPNDYPRYHGKVPVFGSLFTLLLAPLAFVRAKPYLTQRLRLWGVIAGVHGALFIWYWTHHQDRYLQVIVPLMTAVTASSIVLLWRSGWLTRGALLLLLALQVVWGGDVYFIQAHAMIKAPIKRVNDLLQMGHKRQYAQRLNVFAGWRSLRKLVPAKARLLLHDNHTHTGIGRTSVSDWQGWQYGINYGRMSGPREVDSLLRGMGVTHLVWAKHRSAGWDSLAGDIMFFNFATHYAGKPRRVGSAVLAEMPAQPPSEEWADTVAIIGCEKRYRTGLYRVNQLTVPVFGPRRHDYPVPIDSGPRAKMNDDELVAHAAFVAVDQSCKRKFPAAARGDFEVIAKRPRKKDPDRGRGSMVIWSRRKGQPTPLEAAP